MIINIYKLYCCKHIGIGSLLDKSQKYAELKIDEKSIKVPVSKGTLGPDVLDIRSLYKETGLFTYDPGFTSTASCDSNITFIDGDKENYFTEVINRRAG